MAEKVIAIKMTLDAGQTVSEIENVEQGLKGVDEQIDNINNDSKKLSQAEKSFGDLNKRVESGEMTIKQMSRAVKEYQTIAIQAGKDSPIGQQALQKAAQLKDELGDLQTQVSNLGHDGKNMQAALQLGSTVIGGYSAFQGITAALGVENEELAKTFVKLQGAQAALAGIEQIRANLEKESFMMLKAKAIQTNVLTAATTAYNFVVGTSTGALKAFRIALAMTGIGALIIGLGLLIANFEKVTEWVGKAANALMVWFGFVDAEQQKATKATQEATSALREQTQKRLDDIDKLREEEAKAHSDRQNAFDLEIERMEAEGKDSRELKIAKIQDLLDEQKAILESNRMKLQAWFDYYENLAKLRGQDTETFKESMKAQGVDLDALQTQFNDVLKKNEDAVYSAESKLLGIKNDYREKDAQAAKQANDQRLKELEDMVKRSQQIYAESIDWMNQQWENMAQQQIDIAQNYKELLAEEMTMDEDFELIPEEELDTAVEKLDGFFAQLKAYRETGSENIKAALAESLQSTYDVANQALETLTAINDFANQIGDNRVKKIEQQKKRELSVEGLTAKQKFDIEMKATKAVDEIRKKQFNREKALNIAKATMETGVAVVKALASAPPPANFILAGLVGVAGAAQIATIASQKFEGGAANLTPPDFSGAGAGIDSGGTSDTGQTNIVNANEGGYTETEGLISKVVLVESDVTKMQKDIAKINAIGTL